jgi:diguanylate cyclase (GGDEF)-like protein
MVGRLLADEAGKSPGVFAARYGGEEFALLLSGRSLEAASLLADEIRRRIEESTIQYAGRKLTITMSVGSAERVAGEVPADFIARADEALYAAKEAGRNCVYLHERGMTRAFVTSSTVASLAPLAAELPATTDDALARSISRRIAEWRRGGAKLSLIVARLDNVAAADARGTAQHNQAIRQAGEFLKASLREMDQFSLMAGEIFGMLLPTAQMADAVRIAERMRAAAQQGCIDEQLAAEATLSFGVAEVLSEDDADSLILRARRALEAARRRGGNAVFVNDGVYSTRAQEVLDMAASEAIASA